MTMAYWAALKFQHNLQILLLSWKLKIPPEFILRFLFIAYMLMAHEKSETRNALSLCLALSEVPEEKWEGQLYCTEI